MLSRLLHAAYWRVRRLLRRPALVIGTTNPDGTPGDVLEVYSGETVRRPRRGR